MKRITPEMVIDAYIATGTYPEKTCWTNISGGCCGIGALFLAAGGSRNVWEADLIYKKIGCENEEDRDYLCSFSCAFSSGVGGITTTDSDRKDIGYQDGLAAQLAVTAHFAKAPAAQEEMEHAH
jgi:hypothetical protein